MISVALCTYNGEQYIEEQLSSILNQSQKVDEIVVCDDGSTDRTIDILNRISDSNKDVDIRIFVNKRNVGVCTNFYKAVSLCKGDIIFLSDQDDVWKSEKVETILNWFARNPNKSVVFTDADLIDADGKLLDGASSLWNYTGFSSKIQKQFDAGYSFELIAAQNRCTGATMAIRSDFVFDFSKHCNSRVLHDDAIAVAASMYDKLGYITNRLIQYRIHEGQAAGICMQRKQVCGKYSVNSRAEYYKDLEMSAEMKDRLNLFILRASIPKVALMKINRYFSVYGIAGISFWCHDLKKTLAYLMKRKRNIK